MALTGPPTAAFRHTSYQLKTLVLGGRLDLSMFFATFHGAQHGNLVPQAQHSWPHLEKLVLQGIIARGTNPLRWPTKDRFLKLVGCAVRRMPRLNNALVVVDSLREFGFENAAMSIRFFGTEALKEALMRCDNTRPLLRVAKHTPSRSAVGLWKDRIARTKRANLNIEFRPVPSLDDDGNQVNHPWQDWKD